MEMENHIKKLYYYATRNNNAIVNRTSRKYLPLKHDVLSYDSFFDVKHNIRQVKFAIENGISQRQHSIQAKGNLKKKDRKIKKDSQQNLTSFMKIYLQHSHLKEKRKKQLKNQRVNNESSIKIIDHTEQVEDQGQKLLRKDAINIEQLHQKLNGKQVDQYIDKYLYEMSNNRAINLKEKISEDRQKFILQAIKHIKSQIIHDEIGNKQKKAQFDQIQIPSKDKKYKNKNYQSDLESNHQEPLKQQRKMNIFKSKNKDKREKRKSKSTQLISHNQDSRLEDNAELQVNNPVKAQSIEELAHRSQLTLKVPHSSGANTKANISELPLISQRKVYATSSGSEFINKIGKTFYMNEVNLLNKTLELQAKNRERAQRFFKRKLMNIENHYNKFNNEHTKNAGSLQLSKAYNQNNLYSFY